MRRVAACCWLLIALVAGSAAPLVWAEDPPRPGEPPEVDEAFFENRVRPVLVEHCQECHGSDKQEAGLRLDSALGLIRGTDTGAVLDGQNPSVGRLLRAVQYDGETKMPPTEQLPPEQVADLSAWILAGAPWPGGDARSTPERVSAAQARSTWWALQPLRPGDPSPAGPDAGQPGAQQMTSHQAPIDAYIRAELAAQGWQLAQPADKPTLLRRVTYDLTGLPPTPAELAAFLGDDSPAAFEKVVERLLASPQYGERWGRHWLDVVRYADTAGETADFPVPEAYRYRNWVLDATAADLPYDIFLAEQLAGDLRAAGSQGSVYAAHVVATGFLAISRRFGFDSEDYQHLTIQDSLDTLGQAVLGLSVGCARCHDHKFDPVSMADYYGLYGILESTRYAFPGSEQKQRMRVLAPLVPPVDAERLRLDFERQVARIEQALVAARGGGGSPVHLAALGDIDGDFEIQAPAAGGSKGLLVPPWRTVGQPQAMSAAQSPFRTSYPRAGKVGVQLEGSAEPLAIFQHLLPAAGSPAVSRLYFNLDFRLEPSDPASPTPWVVRLNQGDVLRFRLLLPAGSVQTDDGAGCDVAAAEWHSVQVTLDPTAGSAQVQVLNAQGPLATWSTALDPGWDGTLDTLAIEGAPPEGTLPKGAPPEGAPPGDTPLDGASSTAAISAAGPRPTLWLDTLALRREPIAALVEPSQSTEPSSSGEPADAARQEQLTRELEELLARGPYPQAYAVCEGTPTDSKIQLRGEPARPGAQVARRYPEVLGGDPVVAPQAGSGRGQLAAWLTRPESPLAARVYANRIWARHFSAGLVRSENDFGSRGTPPTHPALLDYLADQLLRSGWSTKALHRLILASATYQQAAASDADVLARDPDQRWLAGFPRRRLTYEELRDSLLAAGGTLDRARGGPHPFPTVERSTFTQHSPFSQEYESSLRSVYLMTGRLKRARLAALFDGSDPNASTPRRAETTVPTQALFFLNDPLVHAQAAALAARLRALPDDATRISLAVQTILNRLPSAADSARAHDFLDRYTEALTARGVPASDQAPLVWAAYLRTLFASNEFVYVE